MMSNNFLLKPTIMGRSLRWVLNSLVCGSLVLGIATQVAWAGQHSTARNDVIGAKDDPVLFTNIRAVSQINSQNKPYVLENHFSFVGSEFINEAPSFLLATNTQIKVLDGYLYAANSSTACIGDPEGSEWPLGVSVLDVSNPKDMKRVGTIQGPLNTNVNTMDVVKFQGHNYLILSHDGFCGANSARPYGDSLVTLHNVDNPAAPVLINSVRVTPLLQRSRDLLNLDIKEYTGGEDLEGDVGLVLGALRFFEQKNRLYLLTTTSRDPAGNQFDSTQIYDVTPTNQGGSEFKLITTFGPEVVPVQGGKSLLDLLVQKSSYKNKKALLSAYPTLSFSTISDANCTDAGYLMPDQRLNCELFDVTEQEVSVGFDGIDDPVLRTIDTFVTGRDDPLVDKLLFQIPIFGLAEGWTDSKGSSREVGFSTIVNDKKGNAEYAVMEMGDMGIGIWDIRNIKNGKQPKIISVLRDTASAVIANDSPGSGTIFAAPGAVSDDLTVVVDSNIDESALSLRPYVFIMDNGQAYPDNEAGALLFGPHVASLPGSEFKHEAASNQPIKYVGRACPGDEVVPAPDFDGQVALVMRGTCFFQVKAAAVLAAGTSTMKYSAALIMDASQTVTTGGGVAPGSVDQFGLRIPGQVGCDMMGVDCSGFATSTFRAQFEQALKDNAIGGPAPSAVGLTQAEVYDSDANAYVSFSVTAKVQPFGSLRIWDTSDLKKPKLMSTFNMYCSKLAGVTDPDCLPPLGTTPNIGKIKMENGKRILYMPWGRSGLSVLDITNLKNPVEVARYQRSAPEWDSLNGRNGYLVGYAPTIPMDLTSVHVDPSNGCIFASDIYGGIYALERRKANNPNVGACSGQPFGSIADELKR